MKKHSIFLFATLFLVVGCSEPCSCEQGNTTTISVWDLPHSDYLLLKGHVSRIEEQFTDMTDPEDPYTMRLLTAELDPAGRIIMYNPTGEEFSIASQLHTRGWAPAADVYLYHYDEQGRMQRVSQYILGETTVVTYHISYGDHKNYIPVPFAVMDRPIWLLQGVTSITGSNGYKLQYQENAVTENYPALWGGQKQVSTSFSQSYPLQRITRMLVNRDCVSTATTDYKWGIAGNLLITNTLTDKLEELSSREVVKYDTSFPYGPLEKSISEGDEDVARLYYDYYTDGQLARVRYAKGQESEWFGEAFTKEYSDPDATGNWCKCLKQVSGSNPVIQMPITRTLTYR